MKPGTIARVSGEDVYDVLFSLGEGQEAVETGVSRKVIFARFQWPPGEHPFSGTGTQGIVNGKPIISTVGGSTVDHQDVLDAPKTSPVGHEKAHPLPAKTLLVAQASKLIEVPITFACNALLLSDEDHGPGPTDLKVWVEKDATRYQWARQSKANAEGLDLENDAVVDRLVKALSERYNLELDDVLNTFTDEVRAKIENGSVDGALVLQAVVEGVCKLSHQANREREIRSELVDSTGNDASSSHETWHQVEIVAKHGDQMAITLLGDDGKIVAVAKGIDSLPEENDRHLAQLVKDISHVGEWLALASEADTKTLGLLKSYWVPPMWEYSVERTMKIEEGEKGDLKIRVQTKSGSLVLCQFQRQDDNGNAVTKNAASNLGMVIVSGASDGVSSNTIPSVPATVTANDDDDEVLQEGTHVECRYQDTSKFYPGVVKTRRLVGDVTVYDVLYDDGDAESGVRRLRLRLPGQQQPRLLAAGEQVDVKWNGQMVPGRISCMTEEDVYKVALTLEGGQEVLEEGVQRKVVFTRSRWPPGHRRRRSSSTARKSERRGSNTALSSTLATTKQEPTGTWQMGQNHSPENESSHASSTKAIEADEDSRLDIGGHVECRIGSTPKYVPATITHKSADATTGRILYAVRYEDGELDEKVTRLRLKLPGQKQPRYLMVDQEVDAACSASSGEEVRSGIVTAKDPDADDFYTIRFEDGTMQRSVPRRKIFAQWRDPPTAASSELQ